MFRPSLSTFVAVLLTVGIGGLNRASWAGTLNGSFSSIASGAEINLTTTGKRDWVHWGLYTDTSINRKGSVTPQIGNVSAIGPSGGFLAFYQYANHANGYTWHDGYPETAVTNTTTGIWAYGFPNLGSGFRFEVPADTTTRTLQVYVGVYKGRGTLTATLSDGSAPAYSNNSLFNAGLGPGGVYTLTYAADAPNQTLRIEWTLTALGLGNPTDANVTLQAAALSTPDSNNPPFATITSPARGSAFPEPASILIKASAQDFDGSVTNVAFYAGANLLGQVAAPPYELTWNPGSRGHYELTATATDNLGVTTSSRPVDVFVHGTDGAQTNAVAIAPAAVNLTVAGESDWAHWGLATNTSFNYKAAVPRQISAFTQLGTNPVVRYGDNPTAFSWQDGTPTGAATNSSTGIYITGVGDGFQITAPADTELRQLRVYVGGYGTHAVFQAYLSDLSAPPYLNSAVSNVYDSVHVAYTINYRAASPGQQLIVSHRSENLFDYTYGNVTLAAATLSGGTVLQPTLLFNPYRAADHFRFSFESQSGRTYQVEATDNLMVSPWPIVTNVAGTGGTITITNYSVPTTQQFYRVRTQ
jgi:hypothetical protein